MLPVGAVARCKSNRRAALTFDPAARAPHRAAILARFVPAPQHDYSAILVRLPTSRSDADSRLTAFGRCEYSPPASTGTGHVLHFANEFFQSGGCLRRDLGGASARQRARVPCRRYPVGRLPHRAGAHVHGAPGREADRRTPPHSRVPFASARRREGHHRTDAGWRHRSQPHQCRADRIIDPGSQRARAAVFVPLDRSIGEEILTSSQRHGFVGLTFYDSGSRSIYNSVRPVRTLADMKGLRIRVQQSDLMVDMIKALGAEPIELPYGQVSTGLSTKLIDGAEN